MRGRIFIVDDEPGVVFTVADRLRLEGYEVEFARDGRAALELVKTFDPDVIVLDVMMPHLSGWDVCRAMRSQRVTAPVLMLTVLGDVESRVYGLKIGADDYLAKPFDHQELLARIGALIRRSGRRSSVDVYIGDTKVDFQLWELSADGKTTRLTPLETKMLDYFVSRRGEVVTREELLHNVWGYDARVSTRTIDVHIAGLRQKIEPMPHQPRHLITVHGVGYRLES